MAPEGLERLPTEFPTLEETSKTPGPETPGPDHRDSGGQIPLPFAIVESTRNDIKVTIRRDIGKEKPSPKVINWQELLELELPWEYFQHWA